MAIDLGRLVAADRNRNLLVRAIVTREDDERAVSAIPDQRDFDTAATAVKAGTFTVNGRRAATDSRAPFRANLRFKGKSVVRARIATAFDQVVTADRTVRACR